MEASHPHPNPTPPLPEGAALGYDPAKPVMKLGDLMDWPFGSIISADDQRDSSTIARELRDRSSQRPA